MNLSDILLSMVRVAAITLLPVRQTHILCVAMLTYEKFWLAFVAKAIRNLYFHPLSGFPGPRLAAITDVPIVAAWLGNRSTFWFDKQHQKYGDVVRVAPNDLSFSSPQAFKDIYGFRSPGSPPFLKNKFWDKGGLGATSIGSERNPEVPKRYRKKLAPAFSGMALRSQVPVVLHYTSTLMRQLEKLGADPKGLNIVRWINFVSFDIIGDLTFGESFGATVSGKPHFWIDVVIDASAPLLVQYVFNRIPWASSLKSWFTDMSVFEKRLEFRSYTLEMVEKRVASVASSERIDFFTQLLKGQDTQQEHYEFLIANATTLIMAGSETTATTLSAATYYLLRTPRAMQRLKDEIRGTFLTADGIDGDTTQSLPYLNAVIEETLRIFPPAPFALLRDSPGAVVDGSYIPAGTVVSVSARRLTRSPKYWHDPANFHPERWLQDTHGFYDPRFEGDVREASKPFGAGSRACLGINLGYLEMRIILANLVWHFDWELVSTDVDWERDVRHKMLWVKPELMVRYLEAER